MVQIKIFEDKCAASKSHRREAKEIHRLSQKQNYERPDRFLKRLSGSLKRGAEIDLLKIKLEDFNLILASLKNSSNTALRLYNRSLGSNGEFEPVRFRPSDPTSCTALEKFSRALARAVGAGGWIQQLELGFCIARQDIHGLSESISCSSRLQRLSLTKSAIGDERLQILARGLCECLSLQVLDLSCCNLTDVEVRRTADVEWRLSLRESGGSKSKRRTPRPAGNHGLAALDLSFNKFSDATSRQLCDVLRVGSFLEALNLQGNRLRKKSAQMYLVVFQTVGVPRLVDLRKNLDGDDVGVLEDGRHLRSFSSRQAPLWNESIIGSPSEHMKHQERIPTSSLGCSQKRKPVRAVHGSPKHSFSRDPATSGKRNSRLISTQNLSKGNREHPYQRALLGWSCPTDLTVPRDSSLTERESAAKEACFPEPQGDDQNAGDFSLKPLLPSLRLQDRTDQISPFDSTNDEDQISRSPILDVCKEYPNLTENENRRTQRDEFYGNLSLLHPSKQPSQELARNNKEAPSRPLLAILDPATPELTSRKDSEMAHKMGEQDRTERPSRTAGELISSSRQRPQRSVDNAPRDCTAKLDARQGPNFARRNQLAKHKVRKNIQMHSKQFRSNDHKRGANIDSTSEWQRAESEWGEFSWNMAKTLLRLQEGLDFLMEPSQLDAKKADKIAATELHQEFKS